MDKYNYVYTKETKDEIEIKPEYVYMMIPAEYICVYHKILNMIADFGKNILSQCNKCNKNIIFNSWNIFQSAIANYNIGNKETADKYIQYVANNINKIYKGTDKNIYHGTNIFPISDDGVLKATLSCSENPTFFVDPETGKLYEQYLENKNKDKVFVIEDSELIVKSTNKV